MRQQHQIQSGGSGRIELFVVGGEVSPHHGLSLWQGRFAGIGAARAYFSGHGRREGAYTSKNVSTKSMGTTSCWLFDEFDGLNHGSVFSVSCEVT